MRTLVINKNGKKVKVKVNEKKLECLKSSHGIIAFRTERELFSNLAKKARERGIKGLSFYKDDIESLIKTLNTETEEFFSMGLSRVPANEFFEFVENSESYPIDELKKIGVLRGI